MDSILEKKYIVLTSVVVIIIMHKEVTYINNMEMIYFINLKIIGIIASNNTSIKHLIYVVSQKLIENKLKALMS